MFTVRVTPYRTGLGRITPRQTAGWQLLSRDGRYRFVLDGTEKAEALEEADFWVVQSKGVRRPLTCRVARSHTVLFGTEPPSVLVYPRSYTGQFGRFVAQPPLLPWFVGYRRTGDGTYDVALDYDRLTTAPAPTKTRLLSVVTSDKAFTRGHYDRIRFVERLKARLGDQVDVWGRGIRDFGDKWDVLAPYRYHVAIENSREAHYWTEKISDCFLADTFPFYYGCPELGDYFPADSFLPIDINRPDEAIALIEQTLRTHEQLEARRTAALAEARRLTLETYNMFERIAVVCDSLPPDDHKEAVTLRPCRSGGDWRNLWHYAVTRHYWQWRLKRSGLIAALQR